MSRRLKTNVKPCRRGERNLIQTIIVTDDFESEYRALLSSSRTVEIFLNAESAALIRVEDADVPSELRTR